MDEAEFLMNLKREFLEKASAEFVGWETNLLAFEKTNDRNQIDDLMRRIHSMKGSAQAVGLSDLAILLHALEQFIIQSAGVVPESDLVSTLLSFIDHLREYLRHEVIADADVYASNERIRKMKAILSV